MIARTKAKAAERRGAARAAINRRAQYIPVAGALPRDCLVVDLSDFGLLQRLGRTRGGAEERERELAEERAARHQVVEIGTRRLEAMANERTLPEPIVQHVRSSIERQRHAAPDAPAELDETIDQLLIEIIAEQRQMLHALLRDGKLSDESRRRLERQLDLEEEALRHGLDVVL